METMERQIDKPHNTQQEKKGENHKSTQKTIVAFMMKEDQSRKFVLSFDHKYALDSEMQPLHKTINKESVETKNLKERKEKSKFAWKDCK
jgi:hypothetical protein